MEKPDLSKTVAPSFDLSGKVAIVTGGTKGIGYAIAYAFASYGADVVVSARTEADCERAAKDLAALGVRALGVPADVSKSDQVDALVAKAAKELGKVDIMVCNAGTASTNKAFDMPEAEWDRVMDIDLKGVFLCARAAAKQMVAQETPGRIISIASMAGMYGLVGLSAYCAAKAGVVNLTKALAKEWARYGITVNAVCPGYVLTNINYEDMQNPKVYDKIVGEAAIRRLGKPEEIAAAALYFASDFSAYTTGTALPVDGGTLA